MTPAAESATASFPQLYYSLNNKIKQRKTTRNNPNDSSLLLIIDPCNCPLLAGTPTTGLELDHLSLALLVASQLEVLAALQGSLLAVLALCALHTQHNLLGGLGLLPEDGLSLATESLLLAVVTTTTLGGAALLGLFVLGHLVQFVAPALLAEGLALLGNVHLE